MLTNKTSVILFTLCATALSVNGQSILVNDFSTVTPGVYASNGTADFGDPVLGRIYGGGAGGTNYSTEVYATGGVGNSPRAGDITRPDVAIRSSAVASTTTTTSFSMYFQYGNTNGNLTNNHMFVGSGWTNSNLNYFNGAGMENDTFLVGLRQANENAIPVGQTGDPGALGARFAVGGRFNQIANTDDDIIMPMAVGDWYQLSYNLTFDGTDTWTVEDLALLSWGADGLTGGTSLGFVASYSVDPAFSTNLDSTTNAWAVFFGNRDRNAPVLDNLSAVVVPEPSTYALMLGFIVLGSVAARRRLRK